MTFPIRTAEVVVGQPMVRVDGRLKVTGGATYAADNPIPDLVHAVLVCSTVARGAVDRIDSSAAQRHPGVLRVLDDLSPVELPFDPRQVAFFGQPVAVVVGSTLEAAAHGASLVIVHYTTAAQLTDIDAPQAQRHPGRDQTDYARGNPEAGLRAAAVTTDRSYAIARNNHNPMELPSTIAKWDGDRLTVWDKVQGIVSAHEALATASDTGRPAASAWRSARIAPAGSPRRSTRATPRPPGTATTRTVSPVCRNSCTPAPVCAPPTGWCRST